MGRPLAWIKAYWGISVDPYGVGPVMSEAGKTMEAIERAGADFNKTSYALADQNAEAFLQLIWVPTRDGSEVAGARFSGTGLAAMKAARVRQLPPRVWLAISCMCLGYDLWQWAPRILWWLGGFGR
jgi:hypothetical protein